MTSALRTTLAATLLIVGYETVRAPFVVGWPALAMDSTGSAIAAGVEACAKEGGILMAAAWALFLARAFLRRRRERLDEASNAAS